jgi:integrase
VPGLYVRTTSAGPTFEYRGRLGKQAVSRKLDARTPSEAVKEVERLRGRASDDPGRLVVDRRMTVARLAELFLDAAALEPGYAPTRLDDLRSRLDAHVLPSLGRARVVDVDVFVIRRFARGLPRTMRAKTFRNVLSTLSVMFGWAVAEGLIPENPVARARERFPRDLHRKDVERFEPRALSDEEVVAVLAVVERRFGTYLPVILFIAEAGARVSEALGLRFADVDVQARTWTVSGQLGRDGSVRMAKTPASMVTVPLSPAAAAIVSRRRREAMRTGFGSATAAAFVFTGRTGRPLSRRNVLRAWQQACEEALDERLRLHDLRTTFASRLAARNVDVPTAQALLRHARPSTTLDVYTRIRGDEAARLERMRRALDAADGS